MVYKKAPVAVPAPVPPPPPQWEVGYYDSANAWQQLGPLYQNEEAAARRVNYLNGGTGAKQILT